MKQNVFKSLDPKTGRPDVDPARKPGTGQGSRLLPVALGRQELAADRVQPEDADDLHPGQREPVRDDRSDGRSPTRPGSGFTGATTRAARSRRAPITSAKCRRGTSTPASACGRTRIAKSPNWGPMLATGGGLVFSGGTQRSEVPRLRRGDRQAAVGVPDQLRHHRPAVVVHGRRQAVHRRAVRLGRRLARHAGALEQHRRPAKFPEVPEGGAVWVFAVK